MAACEAVHPNNQDVFCEEEEGPNAMTEPTYKLNFMQNVEVDDQGNPIILVPAREVHVHRGQNEIGETFRWESEG